LHFQGIGAGEEGETRFEGGEKKEKERHPYSQGKEKRYGLPHRCGRTERTTSPIEKEERNWLRRRSRGGRSGGF